MTSRSRTLLTFAALGAAVAIASAFVPLGYDEGNWLADVRRWAAGESLYRDIPDNKTPLLFALVRGLDALPGSFTTVRALYLGAVVLVLGLAVRSLALRLGWTATRCTVLGLVLGAAAATQAVFTVNFELPAVTLVVLGLTSIAGGRGITGGTLAAAAAGFDIRALALLPGIALFARAAGSESAVRRSLTTMAIVAGAWIVAILATPDLRYALIELNVATRTATSSWSPLDQAYAVIRGALFPVAASLILAGDASSRRFRAAGVALVGGGAVVALASLQPFDKYWTLTLPGLAVLAASSNGGDSRKVLENRKPLVAAAVLGIAIAGVYAVTTNIDQARLVARYERVARFLDGTLTPGATFTRFDTEPFLGAFLPKRDRTPTAVLDFAIADTSRRPDVFTRFDRAILGATAIVDDGALSAPESAVLPAYRGLWRIFRRHLADFPCIRLIEGFAVRYRDLACPALRLTGG
jgi:hypothetical protein